MFLQLASHQQVEFLVCAADFEVGFQRDRVVALHQRVEEFVDRDWLVVFVAFAEIVALQHARDGMGRGELDHVGRGQFVHPFEL